MYGMVSYVCTWKTSLSPILCLFHPKDKVPSSKTHRRNRDTAEAMILDEEFRRGETLESDAWANKKKLRKICCKKLAKMIEHVRKRKVAGEVPERKHVFFFFFLVFFWMFFSPTVLFGVSITIIRNVFLIFSINYQLRGSNQSGQ